MCQIAHYIEKGAFYCFSVGDLYWDFAHTFYSRPKAIHWTGFDCSTFSPLCPNVWPCLHPPLIIVILKHCWHSCHIIMIITFTDTPYYLVHGSVLLCGQKEWECHFIHGNVVQCTASFSKAANFMHKMKWQQVVCDREIDTNKSVVKK